MDIYAAGNATALRTNLLYGQAFSVDVPGGTYRFEVRANGAAANSTPAYTSGDVTVTAGGRFTAIATGLLASTAAADRFRIAATQDNFTAPGATETRVRLFHGGSDAPTVNLDLGNDGTVEVNTFERFTFTPEAGVVLPEGLRIGVLAGTSLVTTFTAPASLPDATTATIIATGLLGSAPGEVDGFSLLAVFADNTAAFIRQDARLTVVHGSANAPAVDIYARGVASPLLNDVPFGAAATLRVPPAAYDIDVRAGTAAVTDPAVVSAEDLVLAPGRSYVALAAGLLGGDAASGLRILAFETGFGAPGSNQALVRIVHAGADAPTVDIDVGDDGTAELAGVTRFAESGASGVGLPAEQALQIGIRAGGNRVTAFTTPQLTNGSALYLVATGLFAQRAGANTGFALWALDPSDNPTFTRIAQNPTIYALHACSNAPAVDIWAGNSRVINNIAYPAAGETLPALAGVQVPPGVYPLEIFAHAAGGTKPPANERVAELQATVAAGDNVLAVANGLLGNATTPFAVNVYVDGFEDRSPNASIRFVHAAPAVNLAVDVGVVTGGVVTAVVFANVPYGTGTAAAGNQVAPANGVTLGAAAAGSTTPAATFGLDIPDARLFAIALGGTPVQLGIVNTETGAGPWTFAAIPAN